MMDKLYYDGEEITIRAVSPEEIKLLKEALAETPIDKPVFYLAEKIRTRELVQVLIQDITFPD